MNKKIIDDPQKARYLRKKYKDDGVDQQQQEQQRNFINNPTQAISKSFKHKTQKNLQNQVQYFGNAIQPFHMRQQQQIGNIDQDGFFIFSRRKKARDPWLQSIDEHEQAGDKLVKKIKTQSRFKSVYEADDKFNQQYRQDEQSNEDQMDQKQQQQEQGQQNQKQQQLNTKQIIQLVTELIPQGSNANKYIKKLKAKKQMQLHNKILFLCNLYIQKTGQHDILTLKRQQLEEMVDNNNKQQSGQLNWDQNQQQQQNDMKQQKGQNKKHQLQQKEHQQNNQDDIF